MRITKNPEERKAEIIDKAEELFSTKGYRETAISDIVKAIGVAQGTFYYYFKSKEEVILAVFDKYLKQTHSVMDKVVKDENIKFSDKYLKIMDLQFSNIKALKTISPQIHTEEFAGIHQRIIINTINEFTPVYNKIMNEGIEKRILSVKYPESISQFILVITYFLFDPGIFKLKPEEYEERVDAMFELIEKTVTGKEADKKFIILAKKKCFDIYKN